MALARLIPTEDSFADPSFSTAAISPDGTKLAYLAPKLGRFQVRVRGIDDEHDAAKNPNNLVTMFNRIERHFGAPLGGRVFQ